MTKGVSKGITKENIVNTALELIRDKENIRSVNLREIARVLGCAHTNLYNHFADLDAILWEALDAVLVRSAEFILSGMDEIKDSEEKLRLFYHRLIDYYLQNRGWFRLFWQEKLQGKRSESNIKLTADVVGKYVVILAELFEELYCVKLANGQAMSVFHTVHSYIYGEISIFIAGRGLISEEEEFKKYILDESLKLSKLLVLSL
jgi:AcrR family transcriptional regulator